MLDGIFPVRERKTLCAEEWRPVVGYVGFYEVSSLGRVRSLDRSITHAGRFGTRTVSYRGRVLSPIRCEIGGYTQVRVGLGAGDRKNFRQRLVSNIVAEAFIGPRPEGMEVAHNDGNSENNAASNLRYATPIENTSDKFKHGTVLRGSGIKNSKLSEADVLSIKRLLRDGVTGVSVAGQFGISQAQVSQIRSGKRWGHIDAAL